MRTSMITASAALVAGAAAWGNDTVYVTEVVTAYTTYCPVATQITHGGQTYTVTEVRLEGSLAGSVFTDAMFCRLLP